MFKAYNELLGHQPSLQRVFESAGDVHQLIITYKDVKSSSRFLLVASILTFHSLIKVLAACGDDATSLKQVVVQWLMSAEPKPEPPLEQDEKDGRGFDHDLTGHFLCPIDYNWNDPL